MTIEQKIKYLNFKASVFELQPIEDAELLGAISAPPPDGYDKSFYLTILFEYNNFNNKYSLEEIKNYLSNLLDQISTVIDYPLEAEEKQYIIDYTSLRYWIDIVSGSNDNEIISFLQNSPSTYYLQFFWYKIFYRWIASKTAMKNPNNEIKILNTFFIQSQDFLHNYQIYDDAFRKYMIINE